MKSMNRKIMCFDFLKAKDRSLHFMDGLTFSLFTSVALNPSALLNRTDYTLNKIYPNNWSHLRRNQPRINILFLFKHFIEGGIMEQKDVLLWDEMEIISQFFYNLPLSFSLLFRAVVCLEEWDVLLLFTLSYNWGSVNTGKYKPQSNYKQFDRKWGRNEWFWTNTLFNYQLYFFYALA